MVSVIGSHAGDAAFEVSMRPMLTSAAIAIDLAGGLRAFAKEIPVGRTQARDPVRRDLRARGRRRLFARPRPRSRLRQISDEPGNRRAP